MTILKAGIEPIAPSPLLRSTGRNSLPFADFAPLFIDLERG
jgi:hypothetical protein